MTLRRTLLRAAGSAALLSALPSTLRAQPRLSADRALRPASGNAPPLALADASGRVHDLAALRGRVVLVNFWATWCEPCRDEMPALERLDRSLSGTPFTLLAVNVGELPEKVAPFMDKLGVKLTVLHDAFDRVARVDWKVRMMPATYIVDTRGRLRWSLLGDAEWDQPRYVDAIRRLMA